MHGSTGDIILLGTTTDNLEPFFDDLSRSRLRPRRLRVGLRTPSCCVGLARCEWACIDTPGHLPQPHHELPGRDPPSPFPYKFKIKVSGCPNDCVASIARADLSIIGTWKTTSASTRPRWQTTRPTGLDIQKEVCDLCPTRCMDWDGKKLKIDDEDCIRCMHCINLMPKALRPGKEKGATILIGGKAPIVRAR